MECTSVTDLPNSSGDNRRNIREQCSGYSFAGISRTQDCVPSWPTGARTELAGGSETGMQLGTINAYAAYAPAAIDRVHNFPVDCR
jgi:hypothetical protein